MRTGNRRVARSPEKSCNPRFNRRPGRGVTLSRRVLQTVALALLCFSAPGISQTPVSQDKHATEWADVQTKAKRGARARWWRAIDPQRLSALVEAGVEVNLADRRGWTPLHSAARYSADTDILNILLRAGAEVDARDMSGDTPLHWAAAENPRVEVINTLIRAGADVNARDRFGWQPVHTAAEGNSNPEVIRALLAAGANRNKRAYFVLFRPAFLAKHNSSMSEGDRKIAIALLKDSE